jgi:YspA, cpYpsA-related SLOG family
MGQRILVTVSRGWRDRALMHRVLAACWQLAPGAVLVSGANPDGDRMAEAIWQSLGGEVEQHKARWTAPCRPHCHHGARAERLGGGTYCQAAGDYRNEEMADEGADLCLAFIGPCRKVGCPVPGQHGSHGATGCAAYAECTCSIPTRRFGPDFRR